MPLTPSPRRVEPREGSYTRQNITPTDTGISDASINSTARGLGSAIDNTGGELEVCKARLAFTPAAAPTGTWELYFLEADANGAYDDGSASITPAKLPSCVFSTRSATGAHVNTRRVRVPVGVVKPLLVNSCGQNATGVSLSFFK